MFAPYLVVDLALVPGGGPVGGLGAEGLAPGPRGATTAPDPRGAHPTTPSPTRGRPGAAWGLVVKKIIFVKVEK